MTHEQQALLYLVRLGIGNDIEPGFDFKGVDWRSLIDLSFDQAVAAIAIDGLSKVGGCTCHEPVEGRVDGLDTLDSPEMENMKYEWFGETIQAEEEYSRHQSVFSELVGLLSEQHINVLLLKGLGLSKYYPIPNHRPTGDFDIYAYGQHLNVDSLFRKNGISIDCSYPKHSVFIYKGVTVENHYIYLDSFITKCEKKVQKFIESLYADVLNDDGYYTPSPIKNYFFLLCHTARHFSEIESIRLRHILDWGLFLKAEMSGLDLVLVRKKLQDFDLERTNDLFVSLAERVCGLDFSDLLFERLPEEECTSVLEYILSDKQRVFPKHLVSRFMYKLKSLAGNNWKYHYLSITMRERVWYSIKYHLSGKAEI